NSGDNVGGATCPATSNRRGNRDGGEGHGKCLGSRLQRRIDQQLQSIPPVSGPILGPDSGDCLKGMQEIIDESERLWDQLNEGGMVIDQYRRLRRNPKERRIRGYQEDLELPNRCSMWEFLTQIFPKGTVDIKENLPDEPDESAQNVEETEPPSSIKIHYQIQLQQVELEEHFDEYCNST
ncbi:hypothetical protein PV326_012948, partial [Microctonus aethiopoides]